MGTLSLLPMVSSDLDQTTVHGEPRSGDDPVGDAVIGRGDLVDRYLVMSRLGSGGGGSVYQAHDPELDRMVAIKLVKRRGAEGEQALAARALREGKSMARLSHPNVVAVHDVGTCDAGVFIAMELVEGVDLARWLAMERRSWREVVQVFLQAGQGLAAAHARELIHGDFKPANVFVGADGRVRVGDFGVAQIVSQAMPGPVGTPRYMAPEVHRGMAADEASDQFSFCLALHEALAGRHPLEGRLRDELEAESSDVPALAVTAAPGWLRRLVYRGTRADPGQRHGSMQAIVDQLGGHGRLARRLGFGVAMVGAVVTTAIVVRASDDDVSCDGGPVIEAVWNDDVRRRIEGGLRSLGGQLAQDTAARVLSTTDAYTERWLETYTAVCEATRVEGSQSEALLDVRVACLANRITELSSLLQQLEEPNAEVLRRAVGAIARVPRPEPCRTARRSEHGEPPDAIAGKVRDARAMLGGARASNRLGRYEEAAARVRMILDKVEPLDHPPIVAEAKLVLGRSEAQLGEYDRAVTLLEEAHWTAEAHHHDTVAAEAATELVFVLGELERKPERALAWEPHARASIARSRDDGRIEADLLEALGATLSSKGDYATSLAYFEDCADRRARIYGEGHVEVLSARGNVGSVLDYLGRSKEAQAILTETVAGLEAALGGGHPDVARMLGNLAGVGIHVGELESARDLFERSLEIKKAALGPEHPSLLPTLDGLGVLCRRLDDEDAALRYHESALAIGDESLGPEHPTLASVLINLAQIQLAKEQLVEARASLERALKIIRTAHGERHPWIASAEMVLGAVALAEGKPDEAYSRHSVARDVFAEVHGDASESVGLAESNLGRARHRAGNLVEARVHLEQAWARLEGASAVRRKAVLERLGELELDEGKPCVAQETLSRARALESELDAEPDALTRAKAACRGQG